MFQRDGHKCRKCGGADKQLQWSHVYSRRFKSIRWDLRNSVTLCAGCHFWWHDQPYESIKWIEQDMGSDALENLMADKQTIRRVDREEVRAQLEDYQEMIDNGMDPATLPGCKVQR